MTTTFWALSALLALLAVGFVLWPLLRGEDAEFSRQAREIRKQLASLDRAHADGHVEDDGYARRREALQRQLGALAETVTPVAGGRMTAAALALTVPIAAVFIYQQIGTPQAMSLLATTTPAGGQAPAAAQTADGQQAALGLDEAIANLERRLDADPDDIEGWYLLGQSYMTTNRFVAARDAFARAYELDPDEPIILELYGHAMAFATGDNIVPEEARGLFERAVELNPNSERALYFLGVAAMQREDPTAAVLYWERLAGLLDPASPVSERLAQDLQNARSMAGETPSVASLFPGAAAAAPAPAVTAPAPASEPTSAPPESGGEGLRVAIALDDALRDRVAPNDVVFIFARAAEGPRMPLAIQRVAAGQLPLELTLDESMAMTPAMNITTFPEIVIGARISKTGNATPQPGDLEALSAPMPNDTRDLVELTIDRVL
ncbi:MAG: c-type cytochrome biogenesis protein CcmI [Pseudomonadota bacterium]